MSTAVRKENFVTIVSILPANLLAEYHCISPYTCTQSICQKQGGVLEKDSKLGMHAMSPFCKFGLEGQFWQILRQTGKSRCCVIVLTSLGPFFCFLQVYHPNIHHENGLVCIDYGKPETEVLVDDMAVGLLYIFHNPNMDDPLFGMLNERELSPHIREHGLPFLECASKRCVSRFS